ncbi:helix-turn-helix domain-containing protein [Alkalihalobacillus sp. 1P02AB]|uniref:helix-turn-helix domain-containing protein n=1 Tax=Alkalihalobacillus sp. 1P02AB TaxID=3132260 RepID=UPI0039A427FF
MHNNNVQIACKLIYNTTAIPILLLENNQETIWVSTSKYSSLIEKKTLPLKMVNKLFSIKDQKPVQLAYLNSKNDKIVLMPYPDNEDKLFVLWPNAESYFSPNVKNEDIENSALEFDTNILLNTAILLHYLLYNEQLSLNEVIKENQNFNLSLIPDIIELKIIEQREQAIHHHPYLLEKQLLHAIKLGNKEKMIQYMKIHSKGGIYGTLSKNDSLRNNKNILIVAITLATRAAIEGGLYLKYAYNLSDSYIQHVEGLTNIDSTTKLMEEIFIDFTNRVARVNRFKYTKPILLCQEYIFNHLYEDLTLETLANHVNLSPAYLSKKFKDETGGTLINFIQQQKIDEAKELIIYSNLSISEICSLLNFYDQSYFVKVFKKYTLQTPTQFRNNMIIKQT